MTSTDIPEFQNWTPNRLESRYSIEFDVSTTPTQILATCNVYDIRDIVWGDDGETKPVNICIFQAMAAGPTIHSAQHEAFRVAAYYLEHGVFPKLEPAHFQIDPDLYGQFEGEEEPEEGFEGYTNNSQIPMEQFYLPPDAEE